MTATNAPSDKYHGVWIIFFVLGLGSMLPWHFFTAATLYFIGRLEYPPIDGIGAVNGTVERGHTHNTLESTFSSAMSLSTMLPMLIFTCLNSFIHQKIPQKLRISGSLTVNLLIFLVTAVLVKVKMAPVPFFWVTLVKIFCINSFNAIYHSSVFGLAGLLPVSHTTSLVSGQGMAGVVAAVAMICTVASGSAEQDNVFGYFITACVVCLLSILSYHALPRIDFFQYYMNSDRLMTSSVQDKKTEAAFSPTEGEDKPAVSVFAILKQIWVFAMSVCFILTVTIAMYPAITVHVKSTIAERGGAWDTYFIPTTCFLLFNVMDTVGRGVPAVYIWPPADSIWLPILAGVRVVFIPLFMLCNVQPRHYLPVWFGHDSWYILFMILFAFSNGYLQTVCFGYAPKKVAHHEAETAGAIMIVFLSLGLVLGATLSFAFKAML